MVALFYALSQEVTKEGRVYLISVIIEVLPHTVTFTLSSL